MFLIVFDLLFQMQEKSRRSISKKGRNARFLKIVKLDQPGPGYQGVTTFFAYRSARFFLHLIEQGSDH